jgi:hypothetical protein
MPAICAASAAASERAASLVTLPVSVATPFWTVDWMDSVLRALSPAMRLCRAVLRVASSTAGAAGWVLLHPAEPMVRATAAMVAMVYCLKCVR